MARQTRNHSGPNRSGQQRGAGNQQGWPHVNLRPRLTPLPSEMPSDQAQPPLRPRATRRLGAPLIKILLILASLGAVLIASKHVYKTVTRVPSHADPGVLLVGVLAMFLIAVVAIVKVLRRSL